ncbi:hypothetical protein KUTeg_014056 [Tegillarca granosa]|uniref:AAA+ ATPase domain-containing protein n=1 Tax=Tegillarca granosa TaxID=220873 RepID=A0ABQ9EYY7_TEGGR|nr:hypothetical protein KUTeg_014056 [Tegillarca granosa]
MKVQRKQGTLHTTRRPDRIHPLHLLLSEKDAKKLNISSGETVVFLSVTTRKYDIDASNPNTPFALEVDTPPKDSKNESYSFFSTNSKRKSIIQSYTSEADEEIDINTEDEEDSDENITLYCSPDFLSHYQISPDENIYVKMTNIYPIQKLVIGVTDLSAFKWLKLAKFSTGLLTEVCSHEILIRSNDIFLASYPNMFLEDPSFRTSMYFDMHVLESCPLKTGKLTLNTQLIISLIEESDDDDNDAMKLQRPTKSTKSRDHFLISDFCQPLKPDVLTLNAKTIGLTHVQRSFSSSQIFGYEIIQQHASWRKLFSKTQRKHTFDPLYVIGMSKQTMIHNGFFEESIVEVSMGDSFHNPENSTLPSRLAQVKCILDESEGFSKVIISPLLLFNLQNSSFSCQEPAKTLRIQKYNIEGTDVDIGTTSFSLNANILIAHEVHISIIGDKRRHTSIQNYIPMMMTSYLSHDALTYWDQTYLHGMNRYADKLELLIRPHLQHKLDNPSLKEVLPSIMLTGPSGCGKTTVAVTVARRLNLHIHKVNCHSLYGEASGAIEARIKNVFNAASTYSPCILFLHSIHALGKDKERNTNEFPVVVIGTTHSHNSLATDVQEAFLHEVQIEVPTENDRQEMLDGLLQNVCYSGDVTGQYLAQRTAGFVLGDMAALVAHAKREAYQHFWGKKNAKL